MRTHPATAAIYSHLTTSLIPLLHPLLQPIHPMDSIPAVHVALSTARVLLFVLRPAGRSLTIVASRYRHVNSFDLCQYSFLMDTCYRLTPLANLWVACSSCEFSFIFIHYASRYPIRTRGPKWRSLGLAVMHIFTGTPDTNIMTEVEELLIATLAEKRVQLPLREPAAFQLNPNEPNYELHSTFHAMSFHLLTVGNLNRDHTSRKIQLNQDAGCGSFTLAALAKDYKKSVSPTDHEYRLVPVCVKGDNLIGPILQNSAEIHHCLSPRVSFLRFVQFVTHAASHCSGRASHPF
ncbi:hypothetical protein EUX98_g4730 [Antrodiella citrinella]|uniref:Uncharacterized protein n=1 Tax=Antrodiella citrinella TaxID=2447956 RepID=A0A4S4MU35_9APHY|nr:hypothetical protein EUX98_g4730 [Antrodiella citrinella]